MIYQGGNKVGTIYHLGKAVGSIYHFGQVVWQSVRAMFLTKDNQYIETRDGRIFDAKQ